MTCDLSSIPRKPRLLDQIRIKSEMPPPYSIITVSVLHNCIPDNIINDENILLNAATTKEILIYNTLLINIL
jgi:hypothetical protein